jgi:hypothetical protein
MSTESSFLVRCALAAVIVVLVAAAAVWAQTTPAPGTPETVTIIQPPAAESPKPPYVGKMWELSGKSVFARSGPGTAYYHVAILPTGTQVVVLADDGIWKTILPPKGCHSLIVKKHVETTDGQAGRVTGENVNVRAGPHYAETHKFVYARQGSLNVGDTVKILGEWSGKVDADGPMHEFYRIEPPTGVVVYVASQFCKYVRPYRPAPGPSTGGPAPPLPTDDPTPKQFDNLEKALRGATGKPPAQIDPAELKHLALRYKEVADATRNKYIKSVCEHRVQWIDQRLMLLAAFHSAEDAARKIEGRLDAIAGAGGPVLTPAAAERPVQKRYDAIGRVAVSALFAEQAPNRFRLVAADANGVEHTVCYVESIAGGPDLGRLVGQRIGVIGTDQYIPSWRQHLIYVREADVLEAPKTPEAPAATTRPADAAAVAPTTQPATP